jgi:peptide/nickel transport system substrate-binding protein/glutathione transport system substrate-binding protein
MPLNPSSLDPITGRNGPDFNSLFSVFDALLELDPKTMDLRPGLARSWKYNDLKTFVLDLVQGVTFHDGTPFDADAVKFNLDRAKQDRRSSVKSDLESLDHTEVSGKYQVVLHLNRADASLPTALSDRPGLMASPTAVQKHGPNMDRMPIGTGAWKFVSWEDNNRLVFTRNERYWRPGLPYLDALHFSVINDYSTLLRSVIANQNDIALNLQPNQKPVADREPSVVTVLKPSVGLFAVYLNFGRPPLNDVRIRQALNYAVNREDFNKFVAAGLDEQTSALLPKEHWACDPATANYYPHDTGRARKLLAEAGYPNGIDIPMVGWSDQMSMQRNEVLLAQLMQAGIRIKLTTASPAASAAMFFGPEKRGAGRISFWAGRPDPSQIYNDLFSKDAFFNAGGVDVPGFQQLLDATLGVVNQAARKAAFAKLQRFVIEQALMLPLLCTTSTVVTHPTVKGFVLDILNKPKFREVYLAA